MIKGSKQTEIAKEKCRLGQLAILAKGKKLTTGYKHTATNRKIMSDKRKGKSPWNKGIKMPYQVWNKGKNGLQVAWNKGLKGYCAGEKHYNWQGGKSFEPYGLEFNEDLKEVIRNRDRRKCQICEMTELEQGKKLSVHHIDYNKLNNDPKNLITLCKSCHMKTNFNRNYWIKFFKSEFDSIEV